MLASTSHDYKYVPFGRCPVVIHLGDFLQLAPTASLSLITNLNEKRDDGSYVHGDHSVTCWLEVQHACNLFRRIPWVLELHGTKRLVTGDPLIDFLSYIYLRAVSLSVNCLLLTSLD